jgi:hypothetical protein
MNNSEKFRYNNLEANFEMALQNNRVASVDVSRYTSGVISRTLQKFVYVEAGVSYRPVYVRASYSDRSRGNFFPLCCLTQRSNAYEPRLRSILPTRVAMISSRHFGLDALVDYAWILNKDIPMHRSLAYVEEFSYEQTRRQLQEGLNRACLKLHFYQTGYQPVAIGFYRALVDELVTRASQPPVLEVIPYYYSRVMGCYSHGQPWN